MIVSVIIAARKKDDVITHVQIDDEAKTILPKLMVIQHIERLHIRFEVKNGEKVHVVAGKYLRSDANDIEEDNLGELPTC